MWLAKLHQDSRTSERHRLETDATLRGSGDEPVDILIADVSSTGCLFVCLEPLEVGAIISVGFAGLGKLQARVVRAEDSRYGAEFKEPLDEDALAQALAAPRDCIVPLPTSQSDEAVMAEDVAATDRWPAGLRLLTLSAMAVGGWGVALALRWLV